MLSRGPRNSENSRCGGVMPLTALNLSLLAGVVALVVDGGTLMETRRHVQAGADAAALAGAADLYANYLKNQGLDLNGTAQASALSIASANGFANDGVQSSVTVNVSPQKYQGGANVGQTIPAGYIEVLIQYNAGHLFSGIFGVGVTPVRARAVARGRCVPLANNAVIAMSLHSSGALTVLGSGGLTVSGGIQINSTSSQAVEVSSTLGITASTITTTSTAAVGLQFFSSLLFGSGGGSPSLAIGSPQPDPLRFLAPPDPTQLGLSTRGTNLLVSSGPMDLYPGVYNGGIQIGNNATVILHANSDGSPGIYYLQGPNGLQISSSANVTTAAGETGGIMIYNDWGSSTDAINLTTFGVVSLTPPTSGPYRGICLFQKRGTSASPAPPMTLDGNGTFNLTGTIYASHAVVNLSGGSSTNVFGGQIIADKLNINGAASVNINDGTQPTASMRLLGLVE